MKKLLFTFFIMMSCAVSFGQVAIGTTEPEPSSILHIESTTGGLLLPRMTEVQLDAMVDPAEGLMVYCTDCTDKGLYAYTGTEFEKVKFGGIDPKEEE